MLAGYTINRFWCGLHRKLNHFKTILANKLLSCEEGPKRSWSGNDYQVWRDVDYLRSTSSLVFTIACTSPTSCTKLRVAISRRIWPMMINRVLYLMLEAFMIWQEKFQCFGSHKHYLMIACQFTIWFQSWPCQRNNFQQYSEIRKVLRWKSCKKGIFIKS